LQYVVFLIWCVLISLKLAMTTSTNVAIQTIELILSMAVNHFPFQILLNKASLFNYSSFRIDSLFEQGFPI
jgi:hypothetical protein